jgi:tRNA G18 (ribose-2'-O)-methylase SpoU
MLAITSLDDPRIWAYRNLKDRQLAREGGLFIAEGKFILQRLLASDFPIESVLLSERRAQEIAHSIRAEVPVYVAPEEVLNQIIGFKFHSGIIAVGRRKPGVPLEQLSAIHQSRATVVICPETATAENIGSLIRISAAFGVDAVLLGERCCDPFWRQSIRVSMGTIFSIPLVRSDNLLRDLRRLKESWGFEMVATVLDERAEPLSKASRIERVGILFGNEAQGLDRQTLDLCDRQITIPMRQGVDSLNVAVAAGIVLYHFSRSEFLVRGSEGATRNP